MKLTDFAKGAPWAIRPEVLTDMLVRLPDLKAAMDAKVDFKEEPEARGELKLEDGVAVIPVRGPMSRRMSLFSILFGGTSYTYLQDAFRSALSDPNVEAILLNIDSPGGTVDGLDNVTDMVFSARGQKPIVALAGGQMTSAAYHLGSAAHRVIVEKTADVGSIGVITVHYDWSKEDEMAGLKRTVMSAGRYKALGNDAEPLSDLAKEMFQERLDYFYSLFVDTVARNRETDAETVLADMADGRIFVGQKALSAGLADEIGTYETAIAAAQSMIVGSGGRIYNFSTKGDDIMKVESIEQLKEAFPELTDRLETDAKKAGAAGVDADAIAKSAADNERARILGLANVQFGEEAGGKFTAVVETGVTVEQFTAVKAAAGDGKGNTEADAVNQAKAAMLENIHQAGADNPGANTGATTTEKDFMAQVDEHMAVHKCGKVDAMKAVMRANPQAHAKYLDSVN